MDIEEALGQELSDDEKRQEPRRHRLKKQLQRNRQKQTAPVADQQRQQHSYRGSLEEESTDVPSSGSDEEEEKEEDGDTVMLEQLNAMMKQRQAKQAKQRPMQQERRTDQVEYDDDDDDEATLPAQHRFDVQDLGETKFFDTESFNLDDQLVRRAVYRVAGELPGKVQRVSAWNFTEKQFRVPGATQWYHLKQEPLNLLLSIFTALKFACGKQERKQAPEKVVAARNNRRRKNNSTDAQANAAAQEEQNAGEQPQDGQAPPTVPQGENLRFLQGNEHLALYVETLTRGSRVAGFRLWLFDCTPGTDAPAEDHFSRGLHESLLEAADISAEVRAQLNAAAQGGATGRGKGVQSAQKKSDGTQYVARREFGYARFTDHAGHFMNISKPYFCMDSCLTLDQQMAVDRDVRAFRDDRDFMQFDTLVDQGYAGTPFTNALHPCNMARLFCKEAAMIYYVCDERIDPQYCQLASYCRNARSMVLPGQQDAEQEHMWLDEEDEAGAALDRLNRALAENCGDSEFQSFPSPHTTYRIPNAFFAGDLIARMPLPHQIGARLYTSDDTHMFRRHFDQRLPEQSPQQPPLLMGLHQSECELTSELLLYNAHHLDEEATRVVSRAQATRQIRDKFKHNKDNEIAMRLKLILTNLSLKGRVFICEQNEEETAQTLKRRQADALALTQSVMNYTNRAVQQDTAFAQDVRHLPYLSLSPAGAPATEHRTIVLAMRRLAVQKIREMNANQKTDAMRKEEKEYEEKYYRKKLSSGYIGFFKDYLEQFGPFAPTMETIKQLRESGEITIDEDNETLRRNVFLRMNVLNTYRYKVYYSHWYNAEGQIPADQEEAAMEEMRLLQDAMYVQYQHEFFTSPDVSMATLGIRSDLQKKPLLFTGQSSQSAEQQLKQHRNRIGTRQPVVKYTQNLRPYGAFVTALNAFISAQMGITHNFKIVKTLYFAKGHHCRWHPQCNNPKLNFILSGNGMAGKSKALQEIKKTCPSGVGDMVTHITDQAFNVDRDLNDILLIYEEFQNKFLGYSNGGSKNASSGAGGGGGTSAGSDKDTCNFFKARLTSGKTTTFSWFENEETGKRDVRISQASVQGNLMGASNNDFTDADLNVLSRLILWSVPKSKNDTIGLRPSDKATPTMGEEKEQDRAMYELHREVHRIVFLTEKMIQSGVLGDQVYGVNMDGAKVQVNEILDKLQALGIATNDVRKREYVLELSRCMVLFSRAYFGLTSELVQDLYKDPFDGATDIGFNPLVMLEGIVPFLVATKDEVIDAVTSLSCLWYHDYQDLILEVFATKKCRLQELRKTDFLERRTGTDARDIARTNGLLNASGSNSGLRMAQTRVPDNERETDYNYIRMYGARHQKDVASELSRALGDFTVAENDINKLFSDMKRSFITSYSYTLEAADPEQGHLQTRLVLQRRPEYYAERPVVEMGTCALTGKPYVAVNVHFLYKKLPGLLPRDRIEESADEMPLHRQMAAMSLNDEARDDNLARRLGEINAKTESLIVRAIRDFYENEVLENWHLPEYAELYKECERDGQQPLLRFITADPPRPVKLSQLCPELKPTIAKSKVGDKDIAFHDKLLMLPLQPKASGAKMILYNYNTLAPSVRKTLPVYQSGFTGLVKKRAQLYSETEAWEVDRDIDSISCAVHMQNTGQRRLPSRPHYDLINYPPSLYMALMEQEGLHESLGNYPTEDIEDRIMQRKRRIENENDPANAKYEKYSKFADANFERADERQVFIGSAPKKARLNNSNSVTD